MSNWKPYHDMTPEEKFEADVRRIVNTSVYDAKYYIKNATKDVLIEALRREQVHFYLRVSLIKILESAIRKQKDGEG
jgi:hypothetical protein